LSEYTGDVSQKVPSDSAGLKARRYDRRRAGL
jgi:hypothetical protein